MLDINQFMEKLCNELIVSGEVLKKQEPVLGRVLQGMAVVISSGQSGILEEFFTVVDELAAEVVKAQAEADPVLAEAMKRIANGEDPRVVERDILSRNPNYARFKAEMDEKINKF